MLYSQSPPLTAENTSFAGLERDPDVRSDQRIGRRRVKPWIHSPYPYRFGEGQPAIRRPSIGRRMFRTLFRFSIAVLIGVGATLGWQSYGDTAKEMLVAQAPTLGLVLSVPTTKSPAMAATSTDSMRQLAPLASTLDVVRRSVEQLAARQEQMAQNIAALRAVEDDARQKNRQRLRPRSRPSRPLRPRRPNLRKPRSNPACRLPPDLSPRADVRHGPVKPTLTSRSGRLACPTLFPAGRSENRNGWRRRPASGFVPDECRALRRPRNQVRKCAGGFPCRRDARRICRSRKPCNRCRIQSCRRARLDEIVDKILRVFVGQASRCLFAEQGLVLPRHELASRSEPFGLRHGQQLRLVGFPLDLADDRERNAMPPEHAADGHEAHETHEEVAHAAGRAADIRHLAEYDLELIHHFLPDFVHIGKMRALAQHRLGQVEALAHGGFHRAAMRLVKRVNSFIRYPSACAFHSAASPRSPATVTGGSTAAQSIVAAVQRKKIYCKASAYQ